MVLRDTVLGLVGQMEKINNRLAKIEMLDNNQGQNDTFSNEKWTQTETQNRHFPPASQEAARLWDQFQLSKKTEAQILIDTLQKLDLKNIFESQNKQISAQTNLLNNLSRSISQMAKNGGKSGQKNNQKNSNQNGSSGRPSKKSKKD